MSYFTLNKSKYTLQALEDWRVSIHLFLQQSILAFNQIITNAIAGHKISKLIFYGSFLPDIDAALEQVVGPVHKACQIHAPKILENKRIIKSAKGFNLVNWLAPCNE